MALPTLTMDDINNLYGKHKLCPTTKKVIECMVNDFMDLHYGVESPYTTGKQVLPSGATLEDVEKAAADKSVPKKYHDVFVQIKKTAKSGDLTPLSKNDGTWDPKFTPVLSLIGPNTESPDSESESPD